MFNKTFLNMPWGYCIITSCSRYFKLICWIQGNQSKLFKNKPKIWKSLNMQLISTVLFIKAKLETWWLKEDIWTVIVKLASQWCGHDQKIAVKISSKSICLPRPSYQISAKISKDEFSNIDASIQSFSINRTEVVWESNFC